MGSETPLPAHILREDAELIARTGEVLADEIEQAAEKLRRAFMLGNTVSVVGNRTSGALVTAAGFEFEVFLPPGRAGDLLLAVLPDEPSEDLVGVIRAAHARGLLVVALLNDSSLALADLADLCLRVPATNARAAALAMAAVLHALYVLLYPATSTD